MYWPSIVGTEEGHESISDVASRGADLGSLQRPGLEAALRARAFEDPGPVLVVGHARSYPPRKGAGGAGGGGETVGWPGTNTGVRRTGLRSGLVAPDRSNLIRVMPAQGEFVSVPPTSVSVLAGCRVLRVHLPD